jgi:hypothetical protein
LIKVVDKWELASKSEDGNLHVLRLCRKIVHWIGLDRDTATMCLLHDMEQNADNEIISFANSIIRHDKIIHFDYKKMLPLLIDFYHYLTNTDITDVNELSEDTRLVYPGIFINPRTLNVCICHPYETPQVDSDSPSDWWKKIPVPPAPTRRKPILRL